MRIAIGAFHFSSYVAFRFYAALIRLLPIECVFVIGQVGGELAYRILRRRRELALSNLRLAFGREMSDPQLRALNRRHFQLLGANLLAGLKTVTLRQERILERVTAEVSEKRSQSGWIALLSHASNWEVYSHLGQQLFPRHRFAAIYQPLANPFIDRYLRAARTRAGITLFNRRNQLLSCVRFLRAGGVVGLLADQGAGYAGLWTPLFGRLTSSSTLAARLSLGTGLPVVPVALTTCGRARWKITISEPIYPNHDGPDLFTARINSLLEDQIRRSPDDWLWAHNRWKPLRPHFLFARDQRRVFFPANFDRSTLDPFRVLIISPDSNQREIESTLPAVHAIKHGRPDNSVTVLTIDTLTDVWNHNSAIDRVIEWNRRESISTLVSRIRSSHFDAAVFFATNWRIALAVRLAGVPLRVARRSGVSSWLCNQHPAEPDQPCDSNLMNLHIARSVGADINSALMSNASDRRELQTA